MSIVNIKTLASSWTGLFTEEELNQLDEYVTTYITPVDGVIGVSNVSESNVRKSTVYWIERNKNTEWIFFKINAAGLKLNSHFFGFDIREVSKLQYSVYTAENEDHYTWHLDSCLESDLGNLDLFYQRKLSLVLTCQEAEEGGNLELLGGPSITPASTSKGNAVVFPSFILHRVTPVIKGTRKSLVAWFEGPDWR